MGDALGGGRHPGRPTPLQPNQGIRRTAPGRAPSPPQCADRRSLQIRLDPLSQPCPSTTSLIDEPGALTGDRRACVRRGSAGTNGSFGVVAGSHRCRRNDRAACDRGEQPQDRGRGPAVAGECEDRRPFGGIELRPHIHVADVLGHSGGRPACPIGGSELPNQRRPRRGRRPQLQRLPPADAPFTELDLREFERCQRTRGNPGRRT